ncbi:hypothetical protein F511_21689 [Dorcoceras hygrometricum]|uniref:Uncharacterized protein n=1 Tax=Dorcoceras hygrometricum TaxID=472368 RepID=A0A2Z7CNB2_9LAMI|nr:hypothetical protein F511_21689 [Dorcoceras hygrometricum]
MTRSEIGCFPMDSCPDRECFPRTMPYLPESSPDTSFSINTRASQPPPLSSLQAAAAAVRRRLLRRKIVSGQFDEENPSVQISSRLLVQGDEGVSYPVVDRNGVIYRQSTVKCRFLYETGRSQAQVPASITINDVEGSADYQSNFRRKLNQFKYDRILKWKRSSGSYYFLELRRQRSRGPQQPPNVQIRDSGTSGGSAVRTPALVQRVVMAQRRIIENVLDADRNAESLERQAAAERGRERRRREARMLKRRRKF